MADEQIIEPMEVNEFTAAADAILSERGRTKLKPPPAPPKPRGPERWEVAEPGDTLASAFVKGFEAATDAAGHCCGCNTYGRGTINPFDGSEI